MTNCEHNKIPELCQHCNPIKSKTFNFIDGLINPEHEKSIGFAHKELEKLIFGLLDQERKALIDEIIKIAEEHIEQERYSGTPYAINTLIKKLYDLAGKN